MKKYLKKSFAVLTCTTMCIQTTMAILAEKIPGSDTSQQISIQALTTGQWKSGYTPAQSWILPISLICGSVA